MAAPMENVRLKLYFKINSFLSNNTPSKCWFLVNTNNLHSISDLEREIRMRFDIDGSVTFQLFLEDCVLPAWESLRILRDNDTICICECPVVKTEITAQSDSTCRVECQSEERRTAVSENVNATIEGAGGRNENWSVDVADNAQQEFTKKDKKKKKKTKRKRNRASDDEDNAVATSDYSTEREPTTSGGDRNKDSSVETSKDQEQQIDPRHENKTQKNTKKSRRHLDSDNEVPTLDTSAKRKSDDPGVDISPPRQIVPNLLTVSDGSGDHLMTSMACSSIQQENQLPAGLDNVVKMPTGDRTTSTVLHSDSQVNQSRTVDEIVEGDHKYVASFSDQAPGDKTKKKRKRKRGNKHKLETRSDSVKSWSSADVTNNVAHFPVSSGRNHRLDLKNATRRSNTGHFFFNSDSENEDVIKPTDPLDDTATSVVIDDTATSVRIDANGNRQSENHELDSSLGNCDVLSSEPRQNCAQRGGDVNQIGQLPPGPSQNLSAGRRKSKGTFADIPVFKRQKFKKTAFYPLSKEEQLDTVATNRSLIYKNEDPTETPEVAKRDFSSFPVLHGPPRQGDHIAYKILEMDCNYSPVISDYKEAKVLCYDPVTQNIELDLLHQIEKKAAGRFDVTVEDDTEVLTNTVEASSRVSFTWTSLQDTRLITD